MILKSQYQVEYTGNGTAGREADVQPTGFFFQMPKPVPRQEPEPVAWQCAECGGTHSLCLENRKDIPLYTAPPQRQPEPVGWIYEDDEGRMIFSQMPHPDPLWEPVYRMKEKNAPNL